VAKELSTPLVAIYHSFPQNEKYMQLPLQLINIQFHKVQSRVCIIPFTKPSVAPTTEEEHLAFDELEDALDALLHGPSGLNLCLKTKKKFSVLDHYSREFFKGSQPITGLCY
jgi:hypothetical protein